MTQETSTRSKVRGLLVFGVLSACAIGLFGGGFAFRHRIAQDQAEHIAKQTREERTAERQVEARIIEIVVKRNPQAAIKDFADFPAALLTVSAEAGIDFRLVLAMIDKESEFNPRAVGKAGEIGLMQVMPGTAAALAKNAGWTFVPPSKRRGDGGYDNLGTLGDPKENIRYGVAYLKDQVRQFGFAPATILRGYNRGSAAAREHRPGDRYAEDVALRFVHVSHELAREEVWQ